MPQSISAADVESVVVVDSVGDSTKIAAGAIRDSKNPRDILLAKQAAKVIINSGYFQDGFSIQTGTGGASLAAVKYIREEMINRGIKASFALGGITAHMVKLHQEGLIGTLIDVQSFDKVAAESIAVDPAHREVSAVEYASGQHLGSATHALDIVILSALEVDTDFNVNVLVGSDGIIRGAIGGHQDTAADSALSIIVCPLLRGRIPCVGPPGNCPAAERSRPQGGSHYRTGRQGLLHHRQTGPAAFRRQSGGRGDEPGRFRTGQNLQHRLRPSRRPFSLPGNKLTLSNLRIIRCTKKCTGFSVKA